MIGERLADLRKDKGLTQDELAKELSLSYHTIQSYEQNRTTPDDSIKIRIAKYFNISLDYLLGTTNIEIPLTGGELIRLPKNFPKELVPQVNDYIRLLNNDTKSKRQ